MLNKENNSHLLVKFLSRSSYSADAIETWLRQFPKNEPVWDACRFTFDPEATVYDWLVVFHDLPPKRPGEHYPSIEKLACHPDNTLHVNYEPSNITTYGHHYLQQFGHVLTSHEPSCVRHPNRIYSQPGLPWFYGRSTSGRKHLSYDELYSSKPPTKTKLLSTVCSAKQQNHTTHKRRFNFTQNLQRVIPEIEIFGHGVHPIDDKAQALTAYQYHLAIENHFAPHHWTEKLADSFLGFCLPLYAGCPNATDYFPQESFVRINLDDFDKSVETIQRILSNNEYENRLPAICEARRFILEKHNLFAVLSKVIPRLHKVGRFSSSINCIRSRPALWRTNPVARLHCVTEKSIRYLQGYLQAMKN